MARPVDHELRRRLADVYLDHYDAFLRYSIHKLGNRQDAEDVVHESFARVLKANPDLDVPDALVGYVRAAVNNEANRRGASNSRDRAHRDGGDPAQFEDTMHAPAKPVDERVADEITVGLALAVLTPREREAVALRHIEDRSERETALRMNITLGAAKRYCADGRRRIAAILSRL
ncbi:RNA polymerase sigma factor [Actinophytocola sp. NPDC049390]|uniref:RNA polymerase sigma factor n=1 Tax=Actinophytocola sp. NPDC049390 TaxID=3363894 RepID=UPI003796B5B3